MAPKKTPPKASAKKTPLKKSPVKKTQTKKKPKKKSKIKSSKRISYSTIIIIIIVLLAFFYLHKCRKDNAIDQVIQQTTVTKEEPVTKESSEIKIKPNLLDSKELSLYYPSANLTNGGIVEHLAYSLDYNEDYEQADWVFYELTKAEVLNKKVPRKDKFIPDPSATISSALATDYYKSGYDRGHLCPAADNRWSQTAMEESFYMSNMSPQHPDLNRKIWAELEDKVRDWAVFNEKVFVATGPILADGYKLKIGKSNVAVPNYFYKVVADLTGSEIKGVGFIFVNGQNNGELKYYATSIDMVEERTKIDFFPKLDQKIQKQIESDFKVEDWFK